MVNDLLYKEIEIIKPKKIIVFGNQVSSIFLNKKISVSEWRKKKDQIKIKKNVYFPLNISAKYSNFFKVLLCYGKMTVKNIHEFVKTNI